MVSALYRVYDTVLDMVLKNNLPRIIDGRFHSGKLNQHLAAIPPVLHHPLNGLQMSDGAAEPVQDGLRIGVGMAVAVGMSMTMGPAAMAVGLCGLLFLCHRCFLLSLFRNILA